MIVARKVNNVNGQEINIIKNLLYPKGENELNKNEVIYILEEDDNIIGASSAIQYGDTEAMLKSITIMDRRRGDDLGDGLLRSILNYLYVHGIEKVYYPCINNYLIKKGFEKINCDNTIKERINQKFDDEILACDLEEFFSKGCRGSR